MAEFRDIYQRYVQNVYRFALYLSGNQALAEDITSETFARLWTSDEKMIRMYENSSSYPFEAIAKIGGSGNIQFLERISQEQCLNERANSMALKTLGQIKKMKYQL